MVTFHEDLPGTTVLLIIELAKWEDRLVWAPAMVLDGVAQRVTQ